MAEFVPGKPVVTREPVVEVDGRLEPGRHVFVLVVEDDMGNQSEPARTVVEVQRFGR